MTAQPQPVRTESPPGEPALRARARRVPAPVLSLAAVSGLAACTIAWAALPLSGAYAGARPALVMALACAVLSLAELGEALLTARLGSRRRQQAGYEPPLAGLARQAWSGVRAMPWAEGMTIAVLVLEALHPARPWHTVVLGVAVLGFLLALHLAESAAGPAVLRPQLPLIAAGLGLAAVSAGAALLPAAGSGWLTVVAAAAAVLVAALALPV
jgi:hypothetical protein